MPVIEISSLSHPGVEMFCTLTEAQLRNRIEPDKGIFIVESPKVIIRALAAERKIAPMLVASTTPSITTMRRASRHTSFILRIAGRRIAQRTPRVRT